MNFIFDIGNVLVDYSPIKYLNGLFSDKTIIEKIDKTVFKSPEWLEMDRGVLTTDEAIEIYCAREPEIQSEIRQTMQSVSSMFTPLPDTIKLLPKLKESGHSLYYLSNIRIDIRDYLLEKNEFFNLFTGGVFSCDIKCIKPSPEIYRHLLEKYSLNPQECIFFDDMEENVKAAEKEGIKSVLFTTADCVLKFMRET